jgi:hypothetical protein
MTAKNGWVMDTHVNDLLGVPLLRVELDYPMFGQKGDFTHSGFGL